MSGLLSAVDYALAVRAGWTAFLVFWGTLFAGLLLAGWRIMRPTASARHQHDAASLALVACVGALILAALAPALRTTSVRQNLIEPSRSVWVTAPAATRVSEPTRSTSMPVVSVVTINRIAGLVGILWLAGVLLLLLRLLGGWVVAQRVRRRAREVTDLGALSTLDHVRRHFALKTPISLRRSSEVEAPVVLGERSPALLLPSDLADQMSEDALAPLLAHECAHIARHDYTANLIQTFVEAVLFFSPAVRWISRHLREAREFCCDDAAVQFCEKDRGRYVRVLTTLASLGSQTQGHALMGSTGPRLITRVRRLLSEDAMPRPSVLRLAIVVLATVLIVQFTPGVVRVSASHLAGLRVAAEEGALTWPVPIGFIPRQAGSSVNLEVTGGEDYLADSITLRNLATVPVTSVVLAAVVENSALRVTKVMNSQPVPVSIAPGASASATVRFVSRSDLERLASEGSVPRQVFFGLTRVLFANGSEWSVTPNPAGRTHDEALNLPPYAIPRRLITGQPGTTTRGICQDGNGLQTSHGGVVAVTNEPGHFAVCADGAWMDYAPPPAGWDHPVRRVMESTGDGWAVDLVLHQAGAPVRFRGVRTSVLDYMIQTATVENLSNKAVSAISLGVVVAEQDRATAGVLVSAPAREVTISPNDLKDVTVDLLPPSQLAELRRPWKGRNVVVELGVLGVRWADGSEWVFKLPNGARSFMNGEAGDPGQQ